MRPTSGPSWSPMRRCGVGLSPRRLSTWAKLAFWCDPSLSFAMLPRPRRITRQERAHWLISESANGPIVACDRKLSHKSCHRASVNSWVRLQPVANLSAQKAALHRRPPSIECDYLQREPPHLPWTSGAPQCLGVLRRSGPVSSQYQRDVADFQVGR